MLPVLPALLFQVFQLGQLFRAQYLREFGVSFFVQRLGFFMLFLEDRFHLAFLRVRQLQFLGKAFDSLAMVCIRIRPVAAGKGGHG